MTVHLSTFVTTLNEKGSYQSSGLSKVTNLSGFVFNTLSSKASLWILCKTRLSRSPFDYVITNFGKSSPFNFQIPNNHYSAPFLMRGRARVQRVLDYLDKVSSKPAELVGDALDCRLARAIVFLAFHRGRFNKSKLSVYEEAFLRMFGEGSGTRVPKWIERHNMLMEELRFVQMRESKKAPSSIKVQQKKKKGAAA